MKKLKILHNTTWYDAPGGQRALMPGDEVEFSDVLLKAGYEQLISSWVAAGVAELVK